jgi:hypothetical protein
MSELVESKSVANNPEGAVLILLNSIDLMSDCTGYDVFICNKDGSVAACAELLSNFKLNSTPCEKHNGLVISKAYIQKVKDGGVAEFSTTLGDLAVDGRALRIETFDTERGTVLLTGEVDAMTYLPPEDALAKKKSCRLFGGR